VTVNLEHLEADLTALCHKHGIPFLVAAFRSGARLTISGVGLPTPQDWASAEVFASVIDRELTAHRDEITARVLARVEELKQGNLPGPGCFRSRGA
jgi:hypothetical protein